MNTAKVSIVFEMDNNGNIGLQFNSLEKLHWFTRNSAKCLANTLKETIAMLDRLEDIDWRKKNPLPDDLGVSIPLQQINEANDVIFGDNLLKETLEEVNEANEIRAKELRDKELEVRENIEAVEQDAGPDIDVGTNESDVDDTDVVEMHEVVEDDDEPTGDSEEGHVKIWENHKLTEKTAEALDVLCDFHDAGDEFTTLTKISDKLDKPVSNVICYMQGLVRKGFVNKEGNGKGSLYLPVKRSDGSVYVQAAPEETEEKQENATAEDSTVVQNKEPATVSSDLTPVQAETLDAICHYYDCSKKPVINTMVAQKTNRDVGNVNTLCRTIEEKGFIYRVEVKRKSPTGPVPMGSIPLKRSNGTEYERDLDVAKAAHDKVAGEPVKVTQCPPAYSRGYEPNCKPGNFSYR